MSSQHNLPKVSSASEVITPANPHALIPNFFAASHKDALEEKKIKWKLQDNNGKHYSYTARIFSSDKGEDGKILPRAQQQDKACFLWILQQIKKHGTNELFFTLNEVLAGLGLLDEKTTTNKVDGRVYKRVEASFQRLKSTRISTERWEGDNSTEPSAGSAVNLFSEFYWWKGATGKQHILDECNNRQINPDLRATYFKITASSMIMTFARDDRFEEISLKDYAALSSKPIVQRLYELIQTHNKGGEHGSFKIGFSDLKNNLFDTNMKNKKFKEILNYNADTLRDQFNYDILFYDQNVPEEPISGRSRVRAENQVVAFQCLSESNPCTHLDEYAKWKARVIVNVNNADEEASLLGSG